MVLALQTLMPMTCCTPLEEPLHFYRIKKYGDQLMTSAMEMKYSWAQSAFKYNQLYSGLVSRSDVYVFK